MRGPLTGPPPGRSIRSPRNRLRPSGFLLPRPLYRRLSFEPEDSLDSRPVRGDASIYAAARNAPCLHCLQSYISKGI